ncbi:hypothetical protein GCM10011505_31570 [Tistrella bauzanensis]|uniref:Uncharacterized protein n=1 Tax=Tistrella bauzanensis TaxID=657419 RepID=A0ABQ1IPW1_9PROT|nr:hypothetical protein GCM10011505_31570 [Tistrella bauzanensis]
MVPQSAFRIPPQQFRYFLIEKDDASRIARRRRIGGYGIKNNNGASTSDEALLTECEGGIIRDTLEGRDVIEV